MSVQKAPVALRALLEAPRPLTERLSLFVSLCRALQSQGAALYDLSPEKILLREDGGFLFSAPPAPAPGERRSLPGTPGYLAPERLRGERSPSPKSDIFALGAILYEILTGQRAFMGKNEMEITLATLDGKLQPLKQADPGCPVAVKTLCLRMLSSFQEDRPASLMEVILGVEPFVSTPEAKPSEAPPVVIEPPLEPLVSLEVPSAEQDATISEAAQDEQSEAFAPTMTPPPSNAGSGSGSGSSIPNRAIEQSGPLDRGGASGPGEAQFAKRSASDVSLPRTSEERYQLEGEIARGGLGKITKAHDRQMRRQVAIKETLKQAPQDAQQRFFREAFITAKLEHPSIIPVHELGRWSNGNAYYTMKLVSGQSFEKVIAERKTLPERLALLPHVLAACEAIAYAHDQKIIHRDLKPHNILVGPFGETLVIDWGIAKELGEKREGGAVPKEKESITPQPPYREEVEEAGLTKEGAIIGTPAYMPPEQARGRQVDERADVYSLGAILYHLLTGRPPYTGKRSIAIVKSLLDAPPEPLLQKEPEAPRELADIVEKAMAREAQDRYPSAKELAEDLKKYLTGQLVGAHRYSFGELVKRWVKRHRVALGIAAIATLVIAVGGVYSVDRIIKERNTAEEQRDLAEKNERAAKEAEEKAKLEEAEKTSIAKKRTLLLAQKTLEEDPALSLTYLKSLAQFKDFHDWGLVRTMMGDALSRGVPRFLNADWKKEAAQHNGKVNWVEHSRSGALLASAADDGSVIVWDLSTNQGRLLTGHTGPVYTVRFSPDEKLLASAGEDGDIRLWEVETGSLRLLLKGHTQRVCNIKFSKEGKKLGSVSADTTARLWTVETGQSMVLQGHTKVVFDLDFSPDGARLATASFDTTVRLWDTQTGESKTLSGHRAQVEQVRFLPDGKHLVSAAAMDNLVILWEVKRARQVRALSIENSQFRSLEVSADYIAAGDFSGGVYLWSAPDCLQKACEATPLRGHKGAIFSLAFSHDGKTLASGSNDKTIRLWDVTEKKEQRALRGLYGNVWKVAFSPDDKRLASASEDNKVCLWELSEIEQAAYHEESLVYALAYSPDGAQLASGNEAGYLSIRDDNGRLLRKIQAHTGGICFLAYSPDSSMLASAGCEGELVLWDAKTGESLWKETEEPPAGALRFSKDGKKLLVAVWPKELAIWDLDSHQKTTLHGVSPITFSLSPSEEWLAWLDQKRLVVHLSTSEQGQTLQQIPQPYGALQIGFSPDGKWLVSVGFSPVIGAWALDGTKLSSLEPERFIGHDSGVGALSFSPNSRSFASASDDGTIRIWDLQTKESRPLPSRGAPVIAVAYSPDGKRVAFAGEDRVIQVAGDSLPQDAQALRSLLESRESPPE